MNQAHFDRLVARLEQKYAERPRALRLHVARWVVAGYALFLLCPAVLLILAAAAIVAGAGIADRGGVWLLLAAAVMASLALGQIMALLSSDLRPPRGLALARGDAPRLFDAIDELQAASGRRIAKVLLTGDLNAGVSWIPRLGLLGWPRRYLILGLPLLELLSPDEFRSVLAHEFAHLSANHGRFGMWVYQLRSSWQQVFQSLDKRRGKSSVVWAFGFSTRQFIGWFWPRFNARAFVVCRTHEYFADASAADYTDARTAARALWRIECVGRRLGERVWVDLWRLAAVEPTPPVDLVARLRSALVAPPDPEDAARWVEQGICCLTDQTDTHPSFADRAQALGCLPRDFAAQGFPPLPTTSAATHFFGPALDRMEAEVSREMQAEIAGQWHARHVRSGTLDQRLAAVAPPATEHSRSLTWDTVCLVLERDGPAAAEDLLLQFLAATPDHPGALVSLGRHWLERRRQEGVSMLRHVLEGDDDRWIPAAGQILESHYRDRGEHERLREVRARLDQFGLDLAASQRERSSVKPGDGFLSHGLNAEEFAAVVHLLGGRFDLDAAWLVRKNLRHFAHRRLFVLVVRSRTNWWGSSSEPRDSAVVRDLLPRLVLPGQLLIIAPHGGFRSLARRIMKHPDARIFPAAPAPM